MFKKPKAIMPYKSHQSAAGNPKTVVKMQPVILSSSLLYVYLFTNFSKQISTF